MPQPLAHLRWRLAGAVAAWRRVRLARAAETLLPLLPAAEDTEPWRLHIGPDGSLTPAPAPSWTSAHLRLGILAKAPALRRRARAAWRSGARFVDLFPAEGAGRPAMVWVGDPSRVRGVFRPVLP